MSAVALAMIARGLDKADLDYTLPLIALLLERGARTDIRDKLWNGTPLGWAIHESKHKARAMVEAFEKASADGARITHYSRAGHSARGCSWFAPHFCRWDLFSSHISHGRKWRR